MTVALAVRKDSYDEKCFCWVAGFLGEARLAVVGAIGRGLACWLSARVILRCFLSVFCGTDCELRCRSCSAATLRPGTGSTAPGLLRCRSSRSLPPSLKRMRASCPFCFYRHRASVRYADSPPSMAPRRLRSQRPVSARSLWCGLRSSFLVAPPSRRSVATTRLHATSLPQPIGNVFGPYSPLTIESSTPIPRFVSRSAGRRPATGLAHGRPSGSPCLRRVRSIPRGGILPKIATTSCRRCRYRSGALNGCAIDARGRHPAEEPRASYPPKRKPASRRPDESIVSLRFTGSFFRNYPRPV